MKLVFLAGPYRGDRRPETIAENVAQARRFQTALAEAGIVAYSPNVHDAGYEALSSLSAKQTLKQFTEWVLEHVAEALVVMPGWETSVGTQEEIAFAETKGLPIFYLKDETDLGDLKKWYEVT